MTKCVKRCFTVSVVLNVLLFGVLGGHFFMMWQDHPWWEIKEELAPETQNYVAATFQNAFRDIREVGDEARKTRADLVKILSAEKFDEKAFDKQIKGFSMKDAVLTGVETRTSSPLRITRGRDYQSLNVKGLYPAGEGAGYAGGIMSAGVDGIEVAEAVGASILGVKAPGQPR